ncbi:sugar phosphate nucleotidyltransferase, partial [Patescibacteria group bacterium]
LENLCKDISFSCVFQKKPLGDGHAVLQAAKNVGKEPCAALWPDDIIDSTTPCLSQLTKVFKTCQNPVVALYKLPKEKLPSYGVVKVEKIANCFYKIKEIIEKPSLEEAPSDLGIVGRYILTPEVFNYLKKAKPGKRGEIILSEVLAEMVKDGKIVYGYEFEGKWLECGSKESWLESNMYLGARQLGKSRWEDIVGNF